MAKRAKFKAIGWTGIENDRVYFSLVKDEYCEAYEQVPIADIFRSLKQARKRFEKVQRVYICESARAARGRKE